MVWSLPMLVPVPGREFLATLAHDDVAGEHILTTKFFHSESFTFVTRDRFWNYRLLFYVP